MQSVWEGPVHPCGPYRRKRRELTLDTVRIDGDQALPLERPKGGADTPPRRRLRPRSHQPTAVRKPTSSAPPDRTGQGLRRQLRRPRGCVREGNGIVAGQAQAESAAPERRRVRAGEPPSPLRRGLPRSYPGSPTPSIGGISRDPTSCTSGSRLTPYSGERAAPGLHDQGDRVDGSRSTIVLDEVRVLGRNAGATDRMTPKAAGLQHPPGRELVIGILEHAPERPLVRRLRVFPLLLHAGNDDFRLRLRPRLEAELRASDNLAVPEVRTPIREAELLRGLPPGPERVRNQRAAQHGRDVTPIRARVHPHTATHGPRDRAEELQPTQVRGPRAMEADRVRGASSRHQNSITGLRDRREPP